MRRLVSVLALLGAVVAQVVLIAAPANAYYVDVSVSGACTAEIGEDVRDSYLDDGTIEIVPPAVRPLVDRLTAHLPAAARGPAPPKLGGRPDVALAHRGREA